MYNRMSAPADRDAAAYFYYKFSTDTNDVSLVLDSSPNARHGTRLGGSFLLQNGRKAYNGAGEGTNTIRYVGTQSGITAVTWSAWVYVNSTPGTAGLLVSRGNGATCGLYLEGLNLRHVWDGMYGSQSSLITLTLQTWTHVAVVVTSTASFWYMNGSLVETKTQVYAAVTIGNGNVGTDPVAASYNFPGYLDHVLYSLRSYTGTEIQTLFQQVDTQQLFYKGYLTNFRWTKGQSWYNANFSVPTSNLSGTTTTNIKLLMQASSIQSVTRDASLFSTTVNSQDIVWSSNSPFTVVSASSGGAVSLHTQLNTIGTYLRSYMSEFRNPTFYFYQLNGTGQYIADGGGDMYDNGNATNPWLRSGTQYTASNTQIIPETADYQNTTTTVVDTDWNYVSLGYVNPDRLPLTVLGTRSTVGQPVGWQVSGNSGADGGGALASGMIYNGDIVNGFTVYAMYRCQYNAGDPSHCDLYILLGKPEWGSVFGTVNNFVDTNRDGNGGYLYTSGPNVQNILAIKTLLSKSGGVLVSAAECQTVVQAFLTRMNQAYSGGAIASTGPTVTTGTQSVITSPSTALFFGTVTNEGSASTTARGHVWNTEPSATVTVGNKTTIAGSLGVFSTLLTGLSESTPYYIRAYATNSNTSAYGSESILYIPQRPTLLTTPVTAITSSSLVTGGTVLTTGDRIGSEGVVYNTIPGLDISTSTRTILYGSFSTNTFSSFISSLLPATVYYLRAYATHFITGYGDELAVSTLQSNPALLTVSTTGIAGGSSFVYANLLATGGTSTTVRGFCWDLNSTPTVALSTKTVETGVFSPGIFTSTITGLANSTYYVRAYATSLLGTGYGNELLLFSELYAFTTFTFTNAGATGRSGPTLGQIQSAYSATAWTQNTNYLNMISQGYQRWTVPASGSYRIRCAGAAGGSANLFGGRGIIIESIVSLNRGDVLQLVVGQSGGIGSGGSTGGGGGTFVATNANAPLIVAGGGAGVLATLAATVSTSDASAGTSGQNSLCGTGTGGSGGAGGTGTTNGWGGGGGGFTGNGTDAANLANTRGLSFLNGGTGGDTATSATGGFGGGGGTHGNTGGGGGGGGYSGGGGCNQNISPNAGGGGGSYSVSSVTVIGYNTGMGYITVTRI